MSAPSILIIEDASNILELLKYNFQKEGYQVFCAEDGEQGLKIALKNSPDVILLDLMLPGLDGLEICKILRQNPETKNKPLVMLTAKGEELDKILGLELGADDYITKPFSTRELLARVKAILRRSKPAETESILKAGSIQINLHTYTVTIKDKLALLTNKEFELLRSLMEAKGRVLSREYLLEKVWKYEKQAHIETRTIDMHIGQLRKKLKSEASRLLTIKNVGYRLEVE
jgi:two-component system, OmpR family, alkaline phosphatase synthesis response regulator PhoP